MNLTFYEVSVFAKVRDGLLGGDEGYRALQNVLLNAPRMGDVIPGTNGVRKLRVAAVGQSKGKRGGLRVIYLYIEERDTVIFFGLYAKNVAVNLTPQQKRAIAEAAQREKDRRV